MYQLCSEFVTVLISSAVSLFSEMSNITAVKNFNWKMLAAVDASLTSEVIDSCGIRTHKIQTEFTANEDSVIVESYLRTQYLTAKNTLSFKPVNYLTSENYTPMGVFAKKPFPEGSKIDGLTAFLSKMPEEEVKEGENDFSLIESGRLGRQWLMLGPLAFVNASCKPNIEYKHEGNQWWEQPKLQIFSFFGNTD